MTNSHLFRFFGLAFPALTPSFRVRLRSFRSFFSAFFRVFFSAFSRIAAIVASSRRVASSGSTSEYPRTVCDDDA